MGALDRAELNRLARGIIPVAYSERTSTCRAGRKGTLRKLGLCVQGRFSCVDCCVTQIRFYEQGYKWSSQQEQEEREKLVVVQRIGF